MPWNQIKKIAIFRALQLGDMLCAIPAIRALKKAFPEAQITLIGLPWAEVIVKRYPMYLDAFISFPGFHGLPEQDPDTVEWEDFLLTVRAEAFDLVIQMHGSGKRTNALVRSFGGRYHAGAYLDEKPDGYFVPYGIHKHEIHRMLDITQALVQEEYNDDIHFPIQPEDHSECIRARLNFLPHSYVCIHPGARDPLRRWDPVYFALLADMICSKDLIVVLTGHSDELPIIEEVKYHMRFKPIVAVGKLSLGGSAALIKDALCMISNCTGVAHLGVAVHTKTMVLSLDKEPWRWSPLDQDLHRTIEIHAKVLVHEVVRQVNDFVEAAIHRQVAT